MAIAEPQSPLVPDLDTLERLYLQLKDAPEFREQFAAAARALAAWAA